MEKKTKIISAAQTGGRPQLPVAVARYRHIVISEQQLPVL
jgi:hypothetical protein